jgi:hypothetical protein
VERDLDRAAGGSEYAHDRWLDAERGNRREQTALSRMFGEENAARYLAEVLLAPVSGA